MRSVPYYENLAAAPCDGDPSLVEVERIYCVDLDEFDDAHWKLLDEIYRELPGRYRELQGPTVPAPARAAGVLVGASTQLNALTHSRKTRTMTKYLISFPGPAMDIPDEDMAAVGEAAHAIIREAKEAGVYVFGGGIKIPKNLLFDSDEPDRELSDHERELAERLTTEDLAAIDEALLHRAGQHWRKVAALVANALEKMEHRLPDLPDVYYAQRVRQLVEAGVLESQGNLARMRFSEVRLAAR